MDVVIVESPAKAKTINKYLGKDYVVLASMGHIRDLPSKDGSVDPQADFAMRWEVDGGKKKTLAEIAKAVKDADRVVLATDPDREGEAISWHVLEVLKEKKAIKDKPVVRVAFNAITKDAVKSALQNPREIDTPLVDAYLARRALDYLVGFSLSPVLWRKLPGARSAGRVQSVALRLVCDRELEIETFKPQEYWSVTAALLSGEAGFEARLSLFEGRKLQRLDIGDGDTAARAKAFIEASALKAVSVEAKPVRRNPLPPFTTSTLQQEASSRLGLSPSRTMQLAQRLYEGIDIGGETVGLITYMRTDGVQIASEAIGPIRGAIGRLYGDPFVPEKPRFYSTKAKNAQEAHEAIRPTDVTRLPGEMRKHLDNDLARLYDLVWKRTVASQMESAVFERTTVVIEARKGSETAELRATGSVVTFEGFLKAYERGSDDEDENDARLPKLAENAALGLNEVVTKQHFTEPPPRYSEATLVKRMEELGIGRPSTYAATLAVLKDREYVDIDKRRLVPTDKGRLVTAFLESFFSRYVEYDFTASLEEELDRISAGEIDWRAVLRDFWSAFSEKIDDVSDLRVAEVLEALNRLLGPHIFPVVEEGKDPRVCPTCGTGQLSLKLGRYGAFIGCSNYPDCNYTRQLGADGTEAADSGPQVLGSDDATGEEITLRDGRFGPYVQRGDGKEAKRASLPKGWEKDTITLPRALELLSLPRPVGIHPESGKPIEAGIGRYGPYVSHDGVYANLDSVDEAFTVGLNRAVTVLAEKAARGGRGRSAPAALKTLGDHPDGGPVTLHDGRYGPYVKHDKTNASLPRGKDPDSLTLDEALALIAERAAKAPAKKGARKTPAKKTTTAKKTAARKTTAKKAKDA